MGAEAEKRGRGVWETVLVSGSHWSDTEERKAGRKWRPGLEARGRRDRGVRK